MLFHKFIVTVFISKAEQTNICRASEFEFEIINIPRSETKMEEKTQPKTKYIFY